MSVFKKGLMDDISVRIDSRIHEYCTIGDKHMNSVKSVEETERSIGNYLNTNN